MRKFYFSLGRFALCATLLGAAVTLHTSCVDDQYDLDKEMDLEMNIGGSITIPLGYSAPILLSDMIDTDEIEDLSVEDGAYKISMSDNIEIDLSSLTDVDDMSIAGISDDDVISSTLNTPEFPAFSLDVEDQNIDVDPKLSAVVLGEATELNQPIAISPSLGSLANATEGETISGVELEFEFETETTAIDVGNDIVLPDQLMSISEINFADENGDEVKVTVNMDLTMLSSRFYEAGFTASLGFLKITFPEGYIIKETGDNVYEKSDLTNDGDKIYCEFILEKFVFEDGDFDEGGAGLSKLSGNVVTELDNKIVVSGTTNGDNSSQETDMTLYVNSEIRVDDMSFIVEQVTSDIEGQDLGSDVTIELDDLIEEVKEITLKNDEEGCYNTINISITPIQDVILDPSGDDIQIKFPTSRFVISNISTIETDSEDGIEYYVLNIPLTDIVNGNGCDEDVIISQILFDGIEIVEGEDLDPNTITFNPGIKMVGTTLYLGAEAGSSVKLSTYNAFVDLELKTDIVVKEKNDEEELRVESADITIGGYDISIDDMVNQIEENIELPDELSTIDSMMFPDGEKVYLTIDINVGLEGLTQDLSFNRYSIEFPKFLKFADDFDDIDGVSLTDDNVMIFTGIFEKNDVSGERTFSKSFEIEKIDFSAATYQAGGDTPIIVAKNGKNYLSIDESVKLSGSLKLDGGDVDSSSLPDEVYGTVTYSLNDMAVGKIYGLFNPDIEAETTEVDLSELADLFDGDLSVVLSNPMVTLVAENSLDIPIQIDYLELAPTKNGEAIEVEDQEGNRFTTTSRVEGIVIDAAQDGVATTTTIYISGSEVENDVDADGNKYLYMENFKYLLASLPDNVKMTYEASAITSQTHMVDMAREEAYFFNINYSLDVPLTFDSMSLDYTTTIEELGETMSSLTDFISSVELTIEATSTMPISVEVASITPVDASGNALTGLDSIIGDSNNKIKANSTSTLEIKLTDNDDKDLSKVESLEIRIIAEIDSTEGGAALEPDQQISMKLTARIPDGITLDLNDL